MRIRACYILSLFVISTLANPSIAGPSGGEVATGAAKITTDGSTLTVTQTSDRAIINWQDFSIAAGELTRFVQPDAASATLNRVLGGNPSLLLGSLEANGQVFLINPNGVLVGAGARIDTGSFLASTLDVADADFMQGGDLLFSGDSTAAVQNLGSINALGGDIFLIARKVKNAGELSAPGGQSGLAAGSEVLLTTGGDERVFVQAASEAGELVNAGTIAATTAELKARGGNPYAFAIRNSGVVRATGVAERDGQIWLVAENGGTQHTGTLEAENADGTGGFIETSGDKVDLSGGIDTGPGGQWLIDPIDLTIDASLASTIESTIDADTDITLEADNNITVAANVSANGAGDLELRSDIDRDGAGTIDFDPGITISNTGTGDVRFFYNPAAYATPTDYSANVSLTGGTFTPYMWVHDVSDLQAMNTNLAGAYALSGDIDASATASWNDADGADPLGFAPIGTSGSRFTGTFDGEGHVIEGLTINRPATDNVGLFGYTDGAAITGVGMVGGSVTGRVYVGGLVGENWGTITQSYATGAVDGEKRVGGLVGENWSTITQSYATGAVNGELFVGGLVGDNRGTITQSYATGSVNGEQSVGGLVGFNWHTITQSYATGSVNGGSSVGGLVGDNSGTITQSYWDSDVYATGVGNSSSAGATGLTTVVFQDGTLPSGFDNAVWFAGSGAYPILRGLTPITMGGTVLSGEAGLNLSLIAGGSVLATTTTGAGGMFDFTFRDDLAADPTTALILIDDGSANRLIPFNPAATGIEIADNWVWVKSNTANLTSLIADMDATKGALTAGGILYAVNGGDLAIDSGIGLRLDLTADDFSFDHALDLGVNPLGIWGAGDLLANESITAGTFLLHGGTWLQLGADLPTFSVDDFRLDGGEFIRAIGGEGTEGNPLQIADVYGLQGIGSSDDMLAAHFVLANAIDASGTVGWNNGAGFAPIGDVVNWFTGTFDGQHHAIQELTINRPDMDYVGLFGTIESATIQNVGMIGGSITGGEYVGPLVGAAELSSITGSHATGTVEGVRYVGGLVGGIGESTVMESHASGAVTAVDQVGGLVGKAENSHVSGSHATGTITIGDSAGAGGLIGANAGGEVSDSYAEGDVIAGATGDGLGGLIGMNEGGVISASHATGDVESVGGSALGGLVGINDEGGSISNSYAEGTISGADAIGGLVGINVDSAISRSYATGSVSGDGAVGGLIGINSGTHTVSRAYASGDVAGIDGAGGLVGLNSDGTFRRSFATGNVSGEEDVGGFIGLNSGGVISQSFAQGRVSGKEAVGGFIGLDSGAVISESYASGLVEFSLEEGTGGGFIGLTSGATISDSYWDSDIVENGVGLNAGADVPVGLATADFQDATLPAGFDPEVWFAGLREYPTLRGTSRYTVSGTIASGEADLALSLIGDGQILATTTSGADGAYAFDFTGLPVDATNLLVMIDDGDANRFIPFRSSTATGVEVRSSWLWANSDAANLTELISAMDVAKGVLTDAGILYDRAGGDLDLDTGISLRLDLTADSFSFDQPLNLGSQALDISSANGVTATETITAGIFTLGGGSWEQNVATLPEFSVTDFRLDGGEFIRAIGGDGTAVNPLQIADVYGLQGIGSSDDMLAAHFVLANDIDASGTVNWNNGAGFAPIGNWLTPFAGVFDGQLQAIDGLTIDRPGEDSVGLFGHVELADISRVELSNVSVRGESTVGALVGMHSESSVENSYASGEVAGNASIGGLVGVSWTGTISNSHSAVEVIGEGADSNAIGGLVGGVLDRSIVSESSATGSVTGTGFVGGLVGMLAGNSSVSGSSATGAVTGVNYVGGLVGMVAEENIVSESVASGAVIGTEFVGGLLGMQVTSEILASSASGTVNGETAVGGLVGFQVESGIAESSASGAVTGVDLVGGLTGFMRDSVVGSSNASGVVTGVDGVGGLVGGDSHPDDPWGLGPILGTNAIAGSYATGNVSGVADVGGLAGRLTSGFVVLSHSIGDVVGETDVGGLVGTVERSNIVASHATGAVTGYSSVGGLVGSSWGASEPIGPDADGLPMIEDFSLIGSSYATGDVNGELAVGGLVGSQVDTITLETFATGSVTGVESVGGLVGVQVNSVLADSYASGAVTGETGVGGLVGGLLLLEDLDPLGDEVGLIVSSYASGVVTGTSESGGLVGHNLGGSIDSSYWVNDQEAVGVGEGELSGAIGISRETLQNGQLPAGFLNEVWFTGVGSYPVLRWVTPITFAGKVSSGEAGLSLSLISGGEVLAETTSETDGSFTFTFVGLPEDATTALVSIDDGSANRLVPFISPAITGVEVLDDWLWVGSEASTFSALVAEMDSTLGEFAGTGILYAVDGSELAIDGGIGLRLDLSAESFTFDQPLDLGVDPLTVWGANELLAPESVRAGTFTLAGGLWTQNAATLPEFTVTDFRIEEEGTFLRVLGGDGSAAAPYHITDLYGLQGVGSTTLLSEHFVLANDIDAIGTGSWNDGEGFRPIGYNPIPFRGHFNGQKHTIEGLSINRPDDQYVGLFGTVYTGTIENVGLLNGTVSGFHTVGALAGMNHQGTIANSFSSTSVSGISSVGGLVGSNYNGGSISGSGSTGNVTGDPEDGLHIGGLVGSNVGESTITDSHASGDVSGSEGVGGLVGDNYHSTVTGSHANGDVSGSLEVGGLIGESRTGGGRPRSQITESYATGSVTGDSAVGGLIGSAGQTDIVSASATGDVSGNQGSGGLIGYSDRSTVTRSRAEGSVVATALGAGGLIGGSQGGTITQSFATGSVAGGLSVGGLVGYDSDGTITQSYASGAVDGGALVGGLAGTLTNTAVTLSYASGNITATELVGGLVGVLESGTIDQSYATGTVSDVASAGGLLGVNDGGTITASYWDSDVVEIGIGAGDTSGEEGLSTAGFQDTHGFMTLAGAAGWDFDAVWAPPSAGYYPELYALSPVVRVHADGRRDYGDVNPDFTATLFGGPGLFFAGPSDDALTAPAVSTSADAFSNVGQYAITSSEASLESEEGVTYRVVNTGYLTIDPRALMITANDASKIYGETVTFDGSEFTTAGLQNDETVGSVTLVSDGAVATAGVDDSPYAISGADATGGTFDAGNYTITYTAGALTVSPKDIVVTANGGTSTYGDSPTNPGFAADGLVNGEDESVLTGLGNDFGIVATSDAGDYTLVVDGDLTNGNYNITAREDGTWIVSPKDIVVTANGGTSTYGESPTNPGFAADELVNGEDESVLTGLSNDFAIVATSDAGDYTLVVDGDLTNGNYNITAREDGMWIVSPKDIVVTANGGTSTYGDNPVNPGFAADGLVNGEDEGVLTGLGNDFAIVATSDAGDYTLAVDGELTNGNYSITAREDGTWTVSPKDIVVTANGGTSTYGESPTNSGFVADGLVNGEDESVLTGLSNDFAIVATSDAGDYTLVVDGDLTNGNYTITAREDGTWIVSPKDIVVTANGGTSTYGDSPSNPGFAADGLVNGEDEGVLTGLGNDFAIVATSDAGDYTLVVDGDLTNGNYNITAREDGTWIVSPKDIVVTANGGTSTYGESPADPGFAADGLVNGEDETVLTGLSNDFAVIATSDAGNYTLVVDGDLTNGNYNITARNDGTWIVSPKDIVVTANGGTSTYGDSPVNPGFTADGLVNGEDETVLTGLANDFAIIATSGAGDHTLAVDGELTNGNYNITAREDGTWIVSPKDITVTANGGGSVYGESPVNPGFAADGLVNGEDESVLTGLSNDFAIVATSDAGDYTLAVDGELTNGNYTITAREDGTWIVSPKVIVVTANGGTSTYGDSPSNPGFAADGLVNGEDESVLTGLGNDFAIIATSGAGDYTLVVDGELTNGNYNVTALNDGTWIVSPKDIVVTANGGGSVYGESPVNPGFAADGLVNGEDESVLTGLVNDFAIVATSDAGDYTLAVDGDLTNGNYHVAARNDGTWMVSRKTLVIEANDASRFYREDGFSFTVHFHGLVNNDSSSVVSGLQLSTSATEESLPGSYAITPSGGGAKNYTLEYIDGKLSILPPVVEWGGGTVPVVSLENRPLITDEYAVVEIEGRVTLIPLYANGAGKSRSVEHVISRILADVPLVEFLSRGGHQVVYLLPDGEQNFDNGDAILATRFFELAKETAQ